MGTPITNTNEAYNEIGKRRNSGNAYRFFKIANNNQARFMYGCETWSLTSTEKETLRKIRDTKKGEADGGVTCLHKKEHRGSCKSPSITRITRTSGV
jgi:hypothetical protein